MKRHIHIISTIWNINLLGELGFKLLTPVLELCMRMSCPDLEEKDSFKFPGPTSIVSFL